MHSIRVLILDRHNLLWFVLPLLVILFENSIEIQDVYINHSSVNLFQRLLAKHLLKVFATTMKVRTRRAILVKEISSCTTAGILMVNLTCATVRPRILRVGYFIAMCVVDSARLEN